MQSRKTQCSYLVYIILLWYEIELCITTKVSNTYACRIVFFCNVDDEVIGERSHRFLDQ